MSESCQPERSVCVLGCVCAQVRGGCVRGEGSGVQCCRWVSQLHLQQTPPDTRTVSVHLTASPYSTIYVESSCHFSAQMRKTLKPVARSAPENNSQYRILNLKKFFYPYVNLPSLPLQWRADPGRSAGQEGLLAEDVQVTECRQRHQQPVRAGHLRVHHRPLRHHHRPAFPLQIPAHFTSQEAETSHR